MSWAAPSTRRATVRTLSSAPTTSGLGMRAIGVLHDPTEALVQALRAAMQDVVVSEDIPEEKKPDVVGALDRVLTVARHVDGAAQLIARHLPPSG